MISPYAPHLATGLMAAATAGNLGWSSMAGVHSSLEQEVREKVMGVFKKTYSLLLNPRVYQAATTRGLKVISEAK